MNMPMILRLNKSGMPLDWVTPQIATCLLVKEQIVWSMGGAAVVMTGGINTSGVQSKLELPAIIATSGDVFFKRFVPSLENHLLFRRDNQLCMYCGNKFHYRELTRDHVIPKAQDGRDKWTNVVAACRRCNHRKGPRTPEQANMPLLAVPYEPNQFEFLYLANRRILADQMDFLKNGFSENYRCLGVSVIPRPFL